MKINYNLCFTRVMVKGLFIVLLTSSFTLTAQQSSQTLVNKIWESTFGQPNEYDWSASTIDNFGDLITTGHSSIDGLNSQLLLVKQDPDGATMWANNFQFTPNTKNYGTAISSDNLGNIFVAGVTNENDLESKNDFIVLKYSSSGSESWHTKINGSGDGSDIPTKIINDNLGNVYVTGVSTGDGTQLDFYTIKLNGTNGNIIWEQRYDFSNLYDIPIDISFDDFGNIIVLGASAQSIASWDIALLKYSPLGVLMDEVRLENSTLGFDIPSDFVKDDNGNIYITGSTSLDGVSLDIKTVKLDNQLGIVWSQEFDHGKVDSASAIQTDIYGNVVVTGWGSNSDGGSEFVTLQYNNLGELNWVRERTEYPSNAKAKAKDLTIDEKGNIFLVGDVQNEEKGKVVVTQYDINGNVIWEKKLKNINSKQDLAKSILLNQNNEIFVSSISYFENSKNYNTYKLNTMERHLEASVSTGDYSNHLVGEIIVRFKPNLINTSFIDDKDSRYNKFGQIISDANMIQAFKDKLGTLDFLNWDVIKIHPNYTTADSLTTSRLGKTIRVPDFYNTLVLVVPNRYEHIRGEHTIADSLESIDLKNYVRFAEVNYILTLADCEADDTFYSESANLHPTTNFPNAHINMEPAWCDAGAGNPDVKISIMDSGIRWSHEDFGDGTISGSIVTGGKNYFNGADLSTDKGNDNTSHGTKSAGVIGAIRNNGLGVSGIAGGTGTMDGVRLIGQKVSGSSPDPIPDFISNIIQALPEAHDIFQVDMISASVGYIPILYSDPEDDLAMRETIHYLKRVGIIICAARHNGSSDHPSYPGTIQDEWVLCVAGTAEDGEHNELSRIGHSIDIAGPSSLSIVKTTSSYPEGSIIQSDNGYKGYANTSAATPHATGVAAIIQSYYENLPLVQEDIEYILQSSALDVGDNGYDDKTGHGRLDAGAALQMIEQPVCNIFHFGTDSDPHTKNNEMIAEDITITLNELFIRNDGLTFDQGSYTADVYKVSATVFHAFPPETDWATHQWERHSTSSVFNALELVGTQSILSPVENVRIIPGINQSGVVDPVNLDGYVYYLTNSAGVEGWIPAAPEEAELTYSMIACEQGWTNTDEISNSSIKVYPNPTSSLLSIHLPKVEFETGSIISIFDFSGRLILTKKFNSSDIENSIISLNVKSVPQGMYSCVIQSENKIFSTKFTKI